METGGFFANVLQPGKFPLWEGVAHGNPWVALGLIVGVALTSGILMTVIRRRAGRLSSDEKQGAFALFLTALRKPLALFLWIYGLYLALVVLASGEWMPKEYADWIRRSEPVVHAGGIISFFWLLFRLIRALQKRLNQWAETTSNILDDILVSLAGHALRLVLPAVAAFLLLPLLPIPDDLEWVVSKAFGIFLIGCVAYLIVKALNVTEVAVLRQNRLKQEDNLEARKLYTQVSVLRKITSATVSVVAVGCMLMLFDPVRQLGTSILASAGIAGVVLGFAAQKTLGNLLAGIQIAFTQPIRLDDVVIVEGEWGRIEEITLTYVVVRIWDLRRLVVPINYFIEHPFQNWTRQSADLLGTVFLYVDYTVPVEAVRTELECAVQGNPNWDGKVVGLQVTNCDNQTVELRCLASSADASKGWDLRCEIREHLLAFLKENYPAGLPRVRAELRGLPLAVNAGA